MADSAVPFVQIILDNTLGAILIGTWINCMLYMLEIVMVITFFQRFPNERPWLKVLVAFALFVDTLGTADNNACVYLYTISHWGDSVYLSIQNWPVPAYVILSGLSACVTQLFLCWRYFTLTKNYYVTPFLVAFSLTSFAGALVNAATVVAHSTYAERDFNIKTVTLWLVASVAADMAIAIALVTALRAMPTAFRNTQSMIRRLIASAISTGSATSLLAVVCLILYLYDTHVNITVGFGFCLGRAYTLTMLFNLNQRRSGRSADVTAMTGSAGVNNFSLGNIATRPNDISVGVHQVVHIDDGSKSYPGDEHTEYRPPSSTKNYGHL